MNKGRVVWLMVIMVLTTVPGWADTGRVPQPGGYWAEEFEMPDKVMKTSYDIDTLPMEDRFLLISLAAIIAKQTGQPQLFLTTLGREQAWWDKFSQYYEGEVQEVGWGAWRIVEHFLPHVKGYVLYSKSQGEVGSTKAANVAGVLDAIIICEEMVPHTQGLGLGELANVTPLSETEIFDLHSDYFQHLAIVEGVDWGQQWPWNFYWYIASKSFVLTIQSDGWTPDKLAILPQIPQKGPVFGWSTAINEHQLVDPLGKHGLSINAGNAMGNLPLLYTVRPGEHFPHLEATQRHKTVRDLSWEDDVHYATVYLSDMGNLSVIYRYWPFWDDPVRRDEDRGWGFNAAGAVGIAREVFPLIYHRLFGTATSNDFFFSEVSGAGGYMFPDQWGLDEPDALTLRQHVGADAWNQAALGLNVWMIMVGGSTGFDPWLSDYTETLGRPLGIIYYKHYPHEAFAYQMAWVEDYRGWQVPVAGLDQVAWQGHRSPSEVAANVSAKAHSGAPITRDHYSLAFINYWSDFGSDGSRFEAVKSLVSHVESWVRVVTLEEYFQTMRLRMRPAEFLSHFLSGLDEALDTLRRQAPPTPEAAVALQKAEGYREQAGRHLRQSRMQDCFLASQQAEIALEQARLSFIRVERGEDSLRLSTAPPMTPLFHYHPYELASSTSSLRFKTQDLYLVRRFELQLSESEGCSDPFLQEYTEEDAYILPERGSSYFGRVRAQGAGHQDWGEWSAVFEVRAAGSAAKGAR